MIYSKSNLPPMKGERTEKPVWAIESHAEDVRVDPKHAFRVSDIVKRYVQGADPRQCNNGSAEIPIESKDLKPEHIEALFNSPDFMGAEITDYIDYHELAQSFNDALKEHRVNRQRLAEKPVQKDPVATVDTNV